MRHFYLLIFSLALFSGTAQKVEFNKAMEDGIKAIAELRYSDLHQILNRERKANPTNRVPDYLEAAALCIRGFFVENEDWYSENESRLEKLFARVEDLPDQEPYKRVFLAEMALGRSGIHGKYKNNIKAAWGFYRAYNLLDDNLREFPDFIPTLIPFGVLQTAVGSLPSDYKSVASLFGFKGNIEEGLKMIRKAYYYSLADPKLKFHRDYFGFVYAYVNYELETEEQVSLYTLGMEVGASSFFTYLEAQQKLRSGEAAEALKLLQNRPRGSAYLEVPFFEYYTGKVALMIKPEQAYKHLHLFLETAKDHEHRKSAYRYLAWYHLLNGQKTEAEAYRQKIMQEAETLTGSDKQALDEALRGFNLHLIKARLDFDAGRYARIVENLKPEGVEDCCRKNWERQEYHYRRARALQELGLIDQAIPAFLKAMEYKEPVSFSLANSILQVAILFEHKGNWSQSKRYFKEALALEGYPFHEGVQQKAKAGLERLP
ncbi:tetratricopeptide repeat protein [Croceimicrobium sp.]|uniref:tetratricopeptide repeat protein n=1 Tax=Croceimicrobium sp. TaxID=2828340 RepID=UPI003BABEB27